MADATDEAMNHGSASTPGETVCRLCLSDRRLLTLEHIPPKSTGNLGAHRVELLRFSSEGPAEIEVADGVALNVLCEDCNSRFGSRLGTTFAGFAQQIRESGRFVSPGGGVFACAMDVYPSRVLRQLLLNFLCIAPNGDGNDWQPLRDYIRSREGGPPPNAPRISLYCNVSNTYRLVPTAVLSALGQRREPWVGAEIAFPGLGVVFTVGDQTDSNPVIARKFVDITSWSAFGFGDRKRVFFDLPRYRVEAPHPLAFGSRREVDKWRNRNMIMWLANRFHADVGHDVAAILWRPDRPRRGSHR